MQQMLKVSILTSKGPACEVNLDGPLEIGRQRAGEPGPYQHLPADQGTPARLIVAPQHDKDNISRRHLVRPWMPWNGRSLPPPPASLVNCCSTIRATDLFC